MARKQLAGLLVFIVIIGPLMYFVMREELRQSRPYTQTEMEDTVDVEDMRLGRYKLSRYFLAILEKKEYQNESI
jgi:hypothetical protein